MIIELETDVLIPEIPFSVSVPPPETDPEPESDDRFIVVDTELFETPVIRQ